MSALQLEMTGAVIKTMAWGFSLVVLVFVAVVVAYNRGQAVQSRRCEGMLKEQADLIDRQDEALALLVKQHPK